MAQENLKYRAEIDGLRAVAVLLVIGFHSFPKAFAGGFIGVDIFFVISGFLISSILYAAFADPSANPESIIATFYGRRIRRIFPSLIVVLAACFGVGLFALLPTEMKQLSLHVAASAGFCLNLVLSTSTGYFDGESATKPLLHLWSLGVEEQFYLVWPLVIWLATRGRLNLLRTAVFLAAWSFFWNEYKIVTEAPADFFLPQMRFWELSIGSIAAAIYPSVRRALSGKGESGVASHVVGALGLALIAAGFFLVKDTSQVPDTRTLLPTMGAALVIFAGGSAWTNRAVLSLRPLVWIGLISYPLYLWHWPILTFSQLIFGDDHSSAIRIYSLVGAVVLAWLTYVLLERPIRNGRHGSAKTAVLVVAMTLVGVTGCVTYLKDGFPLRFPLFLRQLANLNYDYAKQWRKGAYFMEWDQDETEFKTDPAEIRRGRPTLYLWGDSHAASLYAGFEASYGASENVVQRTAAGAPPLLGDDIPTRPNAKRITDSVFHSIARDRPETVVLAANWCTCDWRDIAKTIAALKRVGIPRIVVIGPTPQWVGSLTQQIYNHYRRRPFEPIPVRMKEGASEVPAQVDAQMGPFCRQLGVKYISPCSILGNADGYLVRVGDTPDTLIAIDYGHLTIAGSEYLVSHFPEKLDP